jgi:hypothetical protein
VRALVQRIEPFGLLREAQLNDGALDRDGILIGWHDS